MKEYRFQVEMFSWTLYLSFVINLWFVANYEIFKDNYLINNFLYTIGISIFSATVLALLLAWRGFRNERERYCWTLYNKIATLYWLLINNELITKKIYERLKEDNLTKDISDMYDSITQKISPLLIELSAIIGLELSKDKIPDMYFYIILNVLNNICLERIYIYTQSANIAHQNANTDKNIIQKQLLALFEPYLEKLKTEMAIIDKNMSFIDAFFKWYTWENGKKCAYELSSEVITLKTK